MTLQCLEITKSFGGVKALSEISIAFPDSGTVAVIGPNGAGKTTLIHVLTGFLVPESGQCFFDGVDITGWEPHDIARFGIVRTFQDLRLIRGVTSLENVLLADARRIREPIAASFLESKAALRRAEERAMGVLARVGLQHKATDLAGELSWGQQKLLTIACCVATGAKVLILDEPVAGVSPQLAEEIVAFLRELQQENKLIVFVEHDMPTVKAIANTVVVLDGGKLIAAGPAEEVLQRESVVEAYLA